MDTTDLQAQIESLSNNVKKLSDAQSQMMEEQQSNRNALFGSADPLTKNTILEAYRSLFFQDTQNVGTAFTVQPTTAYVKLVATASRTSSTTKAIEKGTYFGQMLILEGTSDTNTVIIKDVAGTQIASDCTLGIYDTLFLLWNGAFWIEIARSNN